MGTKFEVEKFTGENDFGLWKMKMKAMLVKEGLDIALDGEEKLPTDMKDDEKKNLLKKAYSSLILGLGDRVLREVSKETTAASVWEKLEELYVSKTVPDRIYLKQRLFGFKMLDQRSMTDSMDEFRKLIQDLEGMSVTVDDEDQAVILLNSLPERYKNFVETIKYGRQTLKLSEVQAAITAKDAEIRAGEKKTNDAEGLIIRGRPDTRNNKQRGRSRSKSRQVERRRCYRCGKKGHLKKDCTNKDHSKAKKQDDDGDAAVVSDGYESSEVLTVSDSNSGKDWVLDSGCTFHMCPNKCWFSDLESVNGGKVLLGNNEACAVEGIGSVRIKMFDGIERTLKNVRYMPGLRRNLISLGMLDQSGCAIKTQDGK